MRKLLITLLIVFLASPSVVSFARADDISSFVDGIHDRAIEDGTKQTVANEAATEEVIAEEVTAEEVTAEEVTAEATVLATESPGDQQKEPESISIDEVSFLTFK